MDGSGPGASAHCVIVVNDWERSHTPNTHTRPGESRRVSLWLLDSVQDWENCESGRRAHGATRAFVDWFMSGFTPLQQEAQF